MKTDFSEAILQELPALRRFSLTLTRNDHAADDLVQDCVERALSRPGLFEAGTNLRSWLFTIMRNLRVDEHRRTARRGVHVPLDDVHGSGLTTPAAQPGRMELRDFGRAFNRLSADHREVMVLVAVHGMSYEEVADLTKVSLGTVKSRLFRARERLRNIMEADNKPSPSLTRTSPGAVIEVFTVDDLQSYADDELDTTDREGVRRLVARDERAARMLSEIQNRTDARNLH